MWTTFIDLLSQLVYKGGMEAIFQFFLAIAFIFVMGWAGRDHFGK